MALSSKKDGGGETLITKQQRNAGMVFMALGAYVIYYTLANLKIGSIHNPGSGFFTLICGVGIFILSTVLVGKAFLQGVESKPMWSKGGWIKSALGYAVVVGYVVLLPTLGFIISTVVFLLVWQLVVEHCKLKQIISVTALGTMAMYVIFEVLLRVPLPDGVLPL